MKITERIQRLEENVLLWDVHQVRREAEMIQSALDRIKGQNPQNVKKLKERVQMLVRDASMSYNEPERVSVRIIDIVRPIFFGICWGLFFLFSPLKFTANPIVSLTGMVFTLHMIIQSS